MGFKRLPRLFWMHDGQGKQIPWATQEWESFVRGVPKDEWMDILKGLPVGWLFDNKHNAETVLIGKIVWYEDGERLERVKLPRIRNTLQPGQRRLPPRKTPKRKPREDCPDAVRRNPDMVMKDELLIMSYGTWQVVPFCVARPIMRITPSYYAGLRWKQRAYADPFYAARSDILVELMSVYGLSDMQALAAFRMGVHG